MHDLGVPHSQQGGPWQQAVPTQKSSLVLAHPRHLMKLRCSLPSLPPPSWFPHGPHLQRRTYHDGLGWDAWETEGLDWRELGLIEGRKPGV